MKRLIPAFVAALACVSAAGAVAPAPLTTLRQIHFLANSEARKEIPVAFEATVTYFRNYENTLFVQDDGFGIYVAASSDAKLTVGDRILIKGTTRAGFYPWIIPDSITVRGHASLPKPLVTDFRMLIGGDHDCEFVTVHGTVRSVDIRSNLSIQSIRLQVFTDTGLISANIDSDDVSVTNNLLDAEVEITGVASGTFDGKLELTGILLHVPSLAGLRILHRSNANPWRLPQTPMDRILASYSVKNLSARVRVRGVITYYQPGSAVVLQNGSTSLWIQASPSNPMRIGDEADAIGFPDVRSGFLSLASSEVQDLNIQAPITPQPATWQQLTSSKNVFDLVTVEGQVITEVREASQDEYILSTGDRLFSAIYSHPYDAPPMKQVPLGSMVKVTGICVLDDSNPFAREVPFDILLRTFDDIVVVARPSLLNTRNLMLVVGLLLILVFAMLTRGWALERKMRRQTAVLSARTEADAELERQRSRILEDINGSRLLPEVLEEIAAMVSSTLRGAPCWCKAGDGAILGACPEAQDGLRIVRAEIPARSGPPLGTLFAGLDPQTPPALREAEALHNGARLASLAIETRRLYSDLRRRSEYDLLTDVPNRFAMEKALDVKIDEAKTSLACFGLIYIDLDKFKPINDHFGHHVGDLYLQEVAQRIGKQLLGGDMLARLGGDEFAAMVSLQHGRFDLEKIIVRLENCFTEPFIIDGNTIVGSASIGAALFPEDGTNRDDLLNAADAAMYTIKKSKGPAQNMAISEAQLA